MPHKDPAARAAYLRKYREKNAVELKAAKRDWYLANREQAIQRAAERYAANPVEGIERAREWAVANPERVRAHGRKSARKANGIANPTGEARSGPCPCCQVDGPLVCDHDHPTGEVRGWVCRVCNLRMGSDETSVEAVRRTLSRAKPSRVSVIRGRLEYLEKFYGGRK